jgi:hypothetical protein
MSACWRSGSVMVTITSPSRMPHASSLSAFAPDGSQRFSDGGIDFVHRNVRIARLGLSHCRTEHSPAHSVLDEARESAHIHASLSQERTHCRVDFFWNPHSPPHVTFRRLLLHRSEVFAPSSTRGRSRPQRPIGGAVDPRCRYRTHRDSSRKRRPAKAQRAWG